MVNWNYPYNSTGVTVELRDIVESGVDVWKFEYPTYYTGAQKTAFEQKVLDHYWLRQIGQETVGRWLHYFRTRMREIMPYYIQLYESEALMRGIEDPFGNVDIVETFEQENTGTTTTDSTTTTEGTSTADGSESRTNSSEGEKRFSDTPQGDISNINKYLTNLTQDYLDGRDSLTKSDEASTEATSTGTATALERGTVKHTLTKKGNQGVNTYAHDMKELRETFLNIDMMVINELKDLFLQVY